MLLTLDAVVVEVIVVVEVVVVLMKGLNWARLTGCSWTPLFLCWDSWRVVGLTGPAASMI